MQKEDEKTRQSRQKIVDNRSTNPYPNKLKQPSIRKLQQFFSYPISDKQSESGSIDVTALGNNLTRHFE